MTHTLHGLISNSVLSIPSLRKMGALALLASSAAAWAAPGVTFLATNLTDTTVGENLWSYAYSITGPLAEFESVNLLFSSANYSADLSVLSSDSSLSPLVTPPMLAPATDGQVMVTAVSPLLANSTAALSVQFVWTGAGQPGAQPFELLDDQFNLVSTGITAAVPDVSTAALLFAGMIVLLPLTRMRHQR